MNDPVGELDLRLERVYRALELSPEPLHVPLGLVFRPLEGGTHFEWWKSLAEGVASGRTFARATLYVHIPFCARVCTYCLLSPVTHPGKDTVEAYVGALRAQARMFAEIAEPLQFDSLHVGGGTPTILSEGQLDALFKELGRFRLPEGAQIGVEAHPATSTPGRLEILKRHGVHRLSFGVESLTDEVLRNVNRQDQNAQRVQNAVRTARSLGFSINIDLLAGLPGETETSWRDTVERTLDLEPDSLSVNRFLGENSALANFGYGADRDENRRADAMLLDADACIFSRSPPRWPERPLERASFGMQYVWDRSSSARRYFQDDMIGPTSTLALGHGAMGHVHARGFTVAAGGIADYISSLDQGAPPRMMHAPVNARFEMAFFVTEQACRGDLSPSAFERMFRTPLASAFGKEIRFLLERGLLVAHGESLAKPPNPGFQSAHLLAFLSQNAESLEAPVAALAEANAEPAADARTRLGRGDIARLLESEPGSDEREIELEVGSGLDSQTATQLAATAAKRGWRVTVHGDDRRLLGEYTHLGELPPSMLWTRLAVRASQSARGEQRFSLGTPDRARDRGGK